MQYTVHVNDIVHVVRQDFSTNKIKKNPKLILLNYRYMYTSRSHTHNRLYMSISTNHKMMRYSECVREYTSTFSSSRYDPLQNTRTGSGTYAIPSTQQGGRVILGSSYTSDVSSFLLLRILTSPLQAASYRL